MALSFAEYILFAIEERRAVCSYVSQPCFEDAVLKNAVDMDQVFIIPIEEMLSSHKDNKTVLID